MWKKPEDQPVQSAPPPPTNNAVLKSERPECNGVATIGKSIRIKGEITGAEDLVVEGHVEGMIELKQNSIVIGKGGHVTANITGKVIQVFGEVVGDLIGSDQIVIHESGSVRGNVSAPRVSLKDGARLKGAINTEPDSAKAGANAKPADNFAKPSSNGSKSQSGASAHL